MRKYIIISLLFVGYYLQGQQELQFTQFSLAKSYYNPAAVAIDDDIALFGRHRNQWSGINGAPQGQSIIVEYPFSEKSIALGLILNRATIGIQSRHDISASYAYKLELNNAALSFGIQSSFRQFANDFTKDNLIAIDGFDIDASLNRERFTKNIFNVGLGAHLEGEKYYVGLSAPRIIRSNIDLNYEGTGSTESRQLYTMFGLRFNLSAYWNIEPNLLFKLAENAPNDLELNSNFVYQDQLLLGLNIRTGGTQTSLMESMALIIGFQFTEEIFTSMSYDFNTTSLRQYEEGSFEILFRYQIPQSRANPIIQNPRYF